MEMDERGPSECANAAETRIPLNLVNVNSPLDVQGSGGPL